MVPSRDDPIEIAAHYRLALTRLRGGDAAAAIDALRFVLDRAPDHAGARRNLLRARLVAGDYAAVLAATEAVPPEHPDAAELDFLRGSACNALARPEEARDALARSVAREPGFAPAWLNLGNACMDLDDLAAAEAHCRHAVALAPRLLEAHISLGFALTARGRLPAAIDALEAAVRRDPRCVQAHVNLAAAALLAGDLRRGFAEYEWRKQDPRYLDDFANLAGPVWDGGDPAGRTIMVRAEQGLGDTIQFARFLPTIARLGGRPVLACAPPLLPLLRRIDGAHVVARDAAPDWPRHDAWIDLMSLPHALGITLENIPNAEGYLTADPALIAAHAADPPRRRRIGLAWSGNPRYGNDRRRCIPPDLLASLADTGHDLISLSPHQTTPGIAAPPRPLTDYAETAALIANLDLVITVDTSMAHLAGALGRPVWILLPYAPDWRWLLGRDDTPWYRSARLFRQPAPGDWGAVIAAVRAALPEQLNSG